MEMAAAPLAASHRDKTLEFRHNMIDHCLKCRAGNLVAANSSAKVTTPSFKGNPKADALVKPHIGRLSA